MAKNNLTKRMAAGTAGLALLGATTLASAQDMGIALSIPFGKNAKPTKEYSLNLRSGDLSAARAYESVDNALDNFRAKSYAEVPLFTGNNNGALNQLYNPNLTGGEKLAIGAGVVVAIGVGGYLIHEANDDDSTPVATTPATETPTDGTGDDD